MDANELMRRYVAGERNFSGVNLEGVNLRRMALSRIDLSGANLSRADLRETILQRARLQGTSLHDARLHHADLTGADLRGANLRRAELYGATIDGAVLQGADLTDAVMPDGTPPEGSVPGIESATRYARHNRTQLQKSEKAGCYFCLSIFDPNDITNYVDGGETAVCPNCHVDSVLGSASRYQITAEILKQLNRRWF